MTKREALYFILHCIPIWYVKREGVLFLCSCTSRYYVVQKKVFHHQFSALLEKMLSTAGKIHWWVCASDVWGSSFWSLGGPIFEILAFRWVWVVQNLLQTGGRGFFISDVRASGFCASGGFEWCKICLGWRVGGRSQAQARHITSLRYTGGFSSPLYPISFAVVHSLLLCRGIWQMILPKPGLPG